MEKLEKQRVEEERIAAKGDAKELFELGEIYRWGSGVPQDHKEAVKWYRLAAEQGDEFGQRQLGRMYKLTFPRLSRKDIGDMSVDKIKEDIDFKFVEIQYLTPSGHLRF